MKTLLISARCQWAIALSVLVLPLLPMTAAQAQFSSPAGQGTPRGTAGGGSRSGEASCLQQPARSERLMAMAPGTAIGMTTSASPTVWVYLPSTTAKTLEFSLYTDRHEEIYQINVPIQASGWTALTLPVQAVQLESRKSYHWIVAVVCDPMERSTDMVVEGWIQRQDLPAPLQTQLMQASADQQVTLYLEAGYWYEALNTYINLQRSQPNSPKLPKLWTTLLQAAGLNINTVPPRFTNALR